MTKLKRVVFGLAFTTAVALSLVASGGDAYAKTKTGTGPTSTTPSSPTAPGTFNALGVTWED